MSLFKKIVAFVTGKSSESKPSKPSAQSSSQPRGHRKGKPANRRPAASDPASRAAQPSQKQGKRNTGAPNQNCENASRPGKSDRPRKQSFDQQPREKRARSNQPATQRNSTGKRPGGAVSEEQVLANQQAHAQWDPASYVVEPQADKKTFIEMGLPSEILHAVSDLGFKYCTPIQEQSLDLALAGKNVAGRAQTGTGKTAAFLIAVLTRYLRTPEKRNQPGAPRALIIAPTRELVIQICKDADALGKYCGSVRSLAIYGGMDYDRQREEITDEPVDLLVATPGRLLDFMRHRVVDLRQVDTLVIDEADRMLDMGFIPDVRAIVNRLPEKDARTTMLYSATLNETVMRLASMWMRDPVKVEIEGDAVTTDTIKQVVYISRSDEKFKLLFNHLNRYADARTIVFCNRKSTTEHVADSLRRLGIRCETLSGDVAQNKRLRVLDDFRAGKIRTVVATDVAGRGIHVDDVAFVVNFDFPYEPEDYVHRIGRTGRAGATGTAISFADEDESFIIPDIEEYIKEPLKCVQPEEWLFADLPPMQPRRKSRESGRDDRRDRQDPPVQPESEMPPAPVADAQPETAPATPAPVAPEAPAVAPQSEAPATPVAPAPAAPVVEATPVAPAASVAEVRPEAPTAETISEVSPKADAPAKDTPKADAPAKDAPKADAPAKDAPKADVPAKDAPKADAPAKDAPKADAPAKDAPKAKAKAKGQQSHRTPKAQGTRPGNPKGNRDRGAKPMGNPKARVKATEGGAKEKGRAQADGAAFKGPRSPRPMADRVNKRPFVKRTQEQGPRDGSESHHAAAIMARPVYPVGTTPSMAGDSWTPGQ